MTASTICGSFQTVILIEKRLWLPPALPSERKGCQAAKSLAAANWGKQLWDRMPRKTPVPPCGPCRPALRNGQRAPEDRQPVPRGALRDVRRCLPCAEQRFR